MKKKASGLLKQIISMIAEMAKAKTMALKAKTRATKTRLIIFSLLRNRKILMHNLSEKLRSLVAQDQNFQLQEEREQEEDEDKVGDDGNESKEMLLYNNNAMIMSPQSLSKPTKHYTKHVKQQNLDPDYYNYAYEVDEDDVAQGCHQNDDVAGGGDDKYPDLTHSMFESEDFDDPGGSVIDIVKNSKPEGEEFRLENEIDQVADLFIKRFHRQMRIQKQLSLKNYQDMLERSV